MNGGAGIRFVAVLGVLGVAGGLTGCLGQGGEGAATPPPVVASPTTPEQTPEQSPEPVATPSIDMSWPTPTATESQPPATTAPPPAPATTGPAGQGGQVVAASRYRMGSGYYVTAPSGNIRCAISTTSAMDEMKTGCQSTVVVANMKSCTPPESNAPAVWIPASGAVRKSCVNQGFFVQPDAPALAYGAAIQAEGFRCESRTTGITCTGSGGRSFSIAREGISTG